MTNIERLHTWLNEREVLHLYFHNSEVYSTRTDIELNSIPIGEAINYSFGWRDTPEGYDFWGTLSTEWRNEVR